MPCLQMAFAFPTNAALVIEAVAIVVDMESEPPLSPQPALPAAIATATNSAPVSLALTFPRIKLAD